MISGKNSRAQLSKVNMFRTESFTMLSCIQDSTSTTVVLTADGYVCAAQSNKGLLHYWKMTDAGLDDDDEDNLRGVSSNPCYKCSTPEVVAYYR